MPFRKPTVPGPGGWFAPGLPIDLKAFIMLRLHIWIAIPKPNLQRIRMNKLIVALIAGAFAATAAAQTAAPTKAEKDKAKQQAVQEVTKGSAASTTGAEAAKEAKAATAESKK